MNFDPTTRDFLSGATFSNAHRFELGNAGRAPRRVERLVELCRGQRVLHVGCCDHLDLIRAKVPQGVYLHQQLSAVASRCVGMDINPEGIALLHELGFPEVFTPDTVPDDDFDLCLLGDVIEHVGDVATFLKSMARYRFERLVVATPNAFRLRNFLSRGELINTDHRYWFSPFTLGKVAHDAGWRLESFHYIDSPFTRGMRGMIQSRYPMLRETLVGILTP